MKKVVNVKMNSGYNEYTADRLSMCFLLDDINEACDYVKQLDKWGYSDYTLTTVEKCHLYDFNGLIIDLDFITACFLENNDFYQVENKSDIIFNLCQLLNTTEDSQINYVQRMLKMMIKDLYNVNIKRDISGNVVVLK